MTDSLRGSEFIEYTDKLSAERKKRDLIDIKIRKVVETNPPIDLCDEQRRVEHWTQVIAQSNQQFDKKILMWKEQISMYERLIQNATLEKDKPDFRPKIELKKAQQELELKKNYKPKELQRLEIDLEVIDKKIDSLKNLLGFTNEPIKKTEKKVDDPLPTPLAPTPPTPSLPPAPPQENYSNNFDNQPKILMTTKRVKKQIL